MEPGGGEWRVSLATLPFGAEALPLLVELYRQPLRVLGEPGNGAPPSAPSGPPPLGPDACEEQGRDAQIREVLRAVIRILVEPLGASAISEDPVLADVKAEALLDALAAGDPVANYGDRRELIALGSAAHPWVLRRLGGEDPLVRAEAAAYLMQVPVDGGIEGLLARLDDRDRTRTTMPVVWYARQALDLQTGVSLHDEAAREMEHPRHAALVARWREWWAQNKDRTPQERLRLHLDEEISWLRSKNLQRVSLAHACLTRRTLRSLPLDIVPVGPAERSAPWRWNRT